ncbi:peptidoglycan DD-metalloendopeptidase family protein [Marinobacter sp. 1Y8]
MQKTPRLPKKTRNLFVASVISAVAVTGLWLSASSNAVLLPSEDAHASVDNNEQLQQDVAEATTETEAAPEMSVSAPQEPIPPLPVSYEVKPGDTLSEIFDANNVPAKTLHRLLEADAEYLSLETLRPGTSLTFDVDDQNGLKSMSLQVDMARTVTFTRQDDGSFIHNEQTRPVHWESAAIEGEIQGSFYGSGLAAGLTKAQVVEVSQLLKGKLNFRRSLRAGDRFSVLVGREMTALEPTGNDRIEAVTLHRGKTTYNAFLFSDGNYYDENGESVTPAFLRWPTARHYRVTSSFNPARLHPVTGRHAPHNGVDTAAPMNTPVMSTGDGIVSRVGNHPYAGRYIVIDHSGTFKTRYLHLNKVLVKRGQSVKRGQRIALSGNTGRTTGAHLHFEFHVRNHPVNPLTADIPTLSKVPKDKVAAFENQVRQQLAAMRVPLSFKHQYARGEQTAESASNGRSDNWTQQCQRPGQCRYH